MTRVLSALVLLPVVIGTIFFLPPWGTFVLASVAALLAFREYCTIAQALEVSVPRVLGAVAVLLVCFAMWMADRPSDMASMQGDPLVFPNLVYLVLMAGLIVVGAVSIGRGRPAPGVLADAAATLFAAIYIGLPLGALAAVRGILGAFAVRSDFPWPFGDGRAVLMVLLAVIVVSDSAQYYTGRAFGRRPLSPAISPKKTVEGAIGGAVSGTLAMALAGHYVFRSPMWMLALLGAAISLLGIVGDLFESLLKRSAGVKDSSHLIPGHGGVLDRIDSWLFAAPVYYFFVRFLA
ncbi:MAG TPA: phosphatidate cytidylyltransferase [Vicinamibacterales bacterium]|nr:phosphatidate cytidylyltransferase [Vicinamibacterales bacterium]